MQYFLNELIDFVTRIFYFNIIPNNSLMMLKQTALAIAIRGDVFGLNIFPFWNNSFTIPFFQLTH